MDKECIINPKTGRAVVVKGKIGRQVLKKQGKTTAKPVNTMYSKPIGPVKPTEPTTAKPSATRPRPRGRPKKPTEPTGAKPSATRPGAPKKEVNTMYSKPIGPVKPKKEANTMYDKPIGPVKPKTEQSQPKKGRVVTLKGLMEEIEEIRKSVDYDGFRKKLSKMKDEEKMKEYYDDYKGDIASKIYRIARTVQGLPDRVKDNFKPGTDFYTLNKVRSLKENPVAKLQNIFQEEFYNLVGDI
jgi:hypothetical protein